MSFSEHDAAKSLQSFEKFTAPALRHALNAKKILSTERHNNALEKALDTLAGIDGFIVDVDDWIFSFSSRVQFGHNYETFTIRRSRTNEKLTEHDKLSRARRTHAPMPTFTVQTFVDTDEKAAVVAIVETVALLKYVDKHPDQWRTAPTGETFYYCPWRELDNVQLLRVEKKPANSAG